MSDIPELKSILATDCGSTTTKAILIEKVGDEYRLIVRGEAPTTVEAPFEDVTRGVLNATMEVEELARDALKNPRRKILSGDKIITPQNGDEGVDIYISTSSAGGGLQMMVTGVVKNMTAESAERAALGAGAIVIDVLATNDGRMPHQRIERIRHVRPDMILLSGGTDGGTITKVVEIAELIAAARPKARLGAQYQLPIIYAGNKDAQDEIRKLLGDKCALMIVDNIRPVLEKENLKPARDAIHELFMEHVMAHAPGYKKLMAMTIDGRTGQNIPIKPTPGAVGLIMQAIAKRDNINIVGVDIGGATTDVFSVFGGIFNKTVSANLGMSYSISNVLAEAGWENIMRWVPFPMDEADLRNRIKNKMIRPTTIPQTLKELIVEQAIAREALRLAFIQHKALAVGLKGIQQERTISDTFEQKATGETLVNMMDLNLIVGSGGVLSHAPRRNQSALMMMDAYLPEGITKLAVDSIFMMPQLGVLSTVHEKSATEVFDKDCLIKLGTCIAPVGEVKKKDQKVISCGITMPNGETKKVELEFGKLLVIPLGVGEKAKAIIEPIKDLDVGAGKGKTLETELEGGVVGIIFDTRGRQPAFTDLPPFKPSNESERVAKWREWAKAMNAYPEEGLK